MKTTSHILACVLATALVLAILGPVAAEDAAAPKVNINTASVDELAQLDRIGPSYAQRIVEYREQNGPFQRAEDIMLVQGIGEKTWEANKDLIRVK